MISDIYDLMMFSSQEYIDNKTGRDDLNRFQYLQALVTEFQDTLSDDAKYQVLANLANFAYDPINYPHLKKLNVAELFLDMLSEENEKYVEFGISGLCNYCLDPDCRNAILENDGIQEILNCLSSSNEETVLSAITTLIYLKNNQTSEELSSEAVIECMITYSTSTNTRLANLAKIYLQNFRKTT
ncbi:armadillo repeat-containing protein 7-like [Dendronephthya gigantea]|uniref:armadillo repeat-containing protein 7-like n=1 Tax=Dendronephthya gigantea TaxID=151771 RepID=UPI00106CF90D|nr:armadillo repeat-containing protein 7-like [Dendronephthya gigantea]